MPLDPQRKLAPTALVVPPPPPFENSPLKSTVISLGNPLFLENSEENTYEFIPFY